MTETTQVDGSRTKGARTRATRDKKHNCNIVCYDRHTSLDSIFVIFKNMTSHCKMYLYNLKHSNEKTGGLPKVQKIFQAEKSIIMMVQIKSLSIERQKLLDGSKIKRSPLKSLSPFVG